MEKTENFSAKIHKELHGNITRKRLETIKKKLNWDKLTEYEQEVIRDADSGIEEDEKLKMLKPFQWYHDRNEYCENCYYAVFLDGCGYNHETQICYRYPPQRKKELCNGCQSKQKGADDGECECQNFWDRRPIVGNADWCGEWRPKQLKRPT
jgi:hypothetical protein